MQNDQLTFHPYANIFPLISGEEFTAFVKDIEANGQQEPILLIGKQILDGRNRYRACLELDIEAIFKEFTGANPLDYVLSLNLYRRQLSIAQRSVIAAEISILKSQSQTDDAAADDGPVLSIDDAAKLLGISPRSVNSASKVFREGIPELLTVVKSGEVSVSAAEHLTKLNPEQQKEICDRGIRAIKKAAREIRVESKPTKAEVVQEPTAETTEIKYQPDPSETEFPELSAMGRFSKLCGSGMLEGRPADEVASDILEFLNDGLDTQALLFALDVAKRIGESVAIRKLRG